ncbi:MAG: cell wall-binding repeat-containing protein [Firmicutes bacterium]|nr:cell wall-binding repeat-containing protein [Bacillota bacterium]
MSRAVKIYKLLLVYFVLCVFFIGNYEIAFAEEVNIEETAAESVADADEADEVNNEPVAETVVEADETYKANEEPVEEAEQQAQEPEEIDEVQEPLPEPGMEDVSEEASADAEDEIVIVESKSDNTVIAVDSSYVSSVVPGIKRIWGDSAYDTAVEVAKELKNVLGVDRFDSIVVTRGDDPSDALSGSYFAIKHNAPVVLVKEPKTKTGDTENKGVFDLIKDSLAENGTIYILGGPNAVSYDLQNSLSGLGIVDRIWGQTRYDTNLEILNRLNPVGEDVLVATGETFPDALCGAALGKPLLLVKNKLTPEQVEFLKNTITEDSKIYILGGELAISKDLETEIEKISKPERIAGQTRFDTAIEIAERWFKGTTIVGLATGTRFEDALVGGVYANKVGMPVLLSDKTALFRTTYKHILNHDEIKSVTIFGGPLALSDDASAMDQKGNRKTGLLEINGKQYISKNNGDLVESGWQKADNLYYFLKDYTVTPECIAAKNVLDKVGYNLRKAFDWASDTIPYYRMTGKKPNLGAAWFANFIFTNLKGNCYCKTAALYYMAKIMGYDARIVVGSANWGAPHGWLEIKKNNKIYLYDLTVRLAKEYGFLGYEFTYSTNYGYHYDSYKQIMNEYSVTRY